MSKHKTTFIKFLKATAKLDEPIGDLAECALRDKNLPVEKSEEEIINYVEHMANRHSLGDFFDELMLEYKRN
jgi:uncharacterized protein YozE (UPF0346 family)